MVSNPSVQLAGIRATGLCFTIAVLLSCVSRGNQSAEAINQPFVVNGLRVEPDSLNAYLAAHRGFTSRHGEMRCAYRQLGQSGTKVFVWALCLELVSQDGHLVDGSGMNVPAAFQLDVTSGRVRVVGVEIPDDGNRYGPSIRRIFPVSTWPSIFAPRDAYNQRAAALQRHLRVEAATRFGLPPGTSGLPTRERLDHSLQGGVPRRVSQPLTRLGNATVR